MIGKPDPVRGEIVKAFITLNDGYTVSAELLEDIRLFVRRQLSAHAAPREVEVVEEVAENENQWQDLTTRIETTRTIETKRINRRERHGDDKSWIAWIRDSREWCL